MNKFDFGIPLPNKALTEWNTRQRKDGKRKEGREGFRTGFWGSTFGRKVTRQGEERKRKEARYGFSTGVQGPTCGA